VFFFFLKKCSELNKIINRLATWQEFALLIKLTIKITDPSNNSFE